MEGRGKTSDVYKRTVSCDHISLCDLCDRSRLTEMDSDVAVVGARPLTFPEILFAMAGPFLIVCVRAWFTLGIEYQLLKGIVRSATQLFLAGFVLLSFIFSQNSPLVTFGYLSMMALIASVEVTARQIRTYSSHFRDAFITIVFSGGLVGLYGSLIVFVPEPWYNSKIVVPTAGMLLGNSISGPSISVGRLFSEVTEKTHEGTLLALSL